MRDQDGRTYAARHRWRCPRWRCRRCRLAVAAAVSAGARTLGGRPRWTEASTVDVNGYAAVRDLSADRARCTRVTPDGTPFGTLVGPALTWANRRLPSAGFVCFVGRPERR